THVAHMSGGDFYENEQSAAIESAGTLRIEFRDRDGVTTALKEGVKVQKDELISSTFMRSAALREFYETQMQEAKAKDLLLSLHLKATMMKVSDPIMFGHAVSVYYREAFEKHAALFKELGVDPDNGIGDAYSKLKSLPAQQREPIEADLKATYSKRPALAMVDSSRGITNLHVPSDVIIDASMPAAIRSSGQMWNADDKQQDTKFVIPDSSYAPLYDETVKFCIEHGAFDPTTMGTTPNVGLMAQAAEEYGSHDKTFLVPADGVIRV